ncbi:MAG: Lacal_2735 family protein [Microscillaceae bacterium]|nr:Lacal_2735 family protein [Microscillaceae bacterium]
MGLFNLFSKKSEVDILNEKYQKLLKEAHTLSHKNRKASDLKMLEAEEVLQQIDKLRTEENK